jgi:hypothetical protein
MDKKYIEYFLVQILIKNNFINKYTHIPNLNEFFEIYKIIEKERIKLINKKQINIIYCKYLYNICKKRHIFLDNIVKNWDFYKITLNLSEH